jgi:hypothetical protein
MSESVQVFGRRQDVLSRRRCGRRPKSAKAAVMGIRSERQLSGDKLPSAGAAHDGRR